MILISLSRSTLGIFALALLLLLSCRTSGTALEKDPSRAHDVRVNGGDVTVDVHDAPLAQVLRAIGEQAGIEVTIFGDLSTPVTQDFAAVPLEEGIRRLTRGHSLAVTYADDESSGSRVLRGIWVMSNPSTAVAAEASNDAPEVGASHGRGPEDDSGWIGGIQALAEEADRGGAAAVRRLTNLGASEPSAVVREQAVAALGRLAGAEIEPALTAALADADASVRVRAVRGLRGTGTETAVASLARASTDDADPQVRLAALSALMSFPGHTMAQGLVRAMADPDRRVRDAAARGLTWWNASRSSAP